MAFLVLEVIDRTDLLLFVGHYALVGMVLLFLWVRLLSGPSIHH